MIHVGLDGKPSVRRRQDDLLTLELDDKLPVDGLDVLFLEMEMGRRLLVEEFGALDEVELDLEREGSLGVLDESANDGAVQTGVVSWAAMSQGGGVGVYTLTRVSESEYVTASLSDSGMVGNVSDVHVWAMLRSFFSLRKRLLIQYIKTEEVTTAVDRCRSHRILDE